jgi:uncharacterized RDD family membrane protein YckC
MSGYTTTRPPGAGGPPLTESVLTGKHVLAGWWSRVFAQIIDGMIIGVGALVLLIAITAPFSIGFFASDTVGVVSIVVGAFIGVLCVTFVALLYAPAMMARTNGKTVGRIVLGIRVVRANGQPVDFGYAMLREVVVKALLGGICASLTGGLSWVVDNLWPLWDEENRALHDFVVNSRVIKDG